MKTNRVERATGDPAEESIASDRLTGLVDAVMSVPPDPPLALQSLAGIGAAMTDADQVELRIVRGDELILSAASYGLGGPMYVEGAHTGARRFGELLLEEDRPLLMSDLRSEIDLSSVPDCFDRMRSFMGVPLRSVSSSPLIGTWCAFSSQPGNFVPAHLDLWIALGWRVGWEVESVGATATSSGLDRRMLEMRNIGHAINNQLMVLTVGAENLGGCHNLESADASMVEDMVTAAETVRDMVSQLSSVAIAGMESAT